MGDLQAVGPDGKRRLPALRLGQRLGYARDRDIRTLIKSRRSDLEKAGQLICVTIPQIGPGRPAEEFFLDDVQSVLVTMWSDTPYSLDAQIEIARSPWVLTDVCKGVGIENNREVAGRLKDDEKANVSISDGRRAALELLVLKLGIEPFEKLLKARDIRASIVEAGGGAVIGARGPIDFSVYHRFSKR
jgi:hypothetical protein